MQKKVNHSDFYYFLMQASWPLYGLLLFISFFFINALFAFLYWLDSGGVHGASSYMEHFFFSVQTITTIGYGRMAPMSTFAHVVVSFEAGIGILSAAIIAGFTFAKASKPTTRILFDEKIEFGEKNGKKMLHFKIINPRGNDIFSAKVHATALFEQDPEGGSKHRRLEMMKLEGSFSPFFSSVWHINHYLDEHSPFAVTSDGQLREEPNLVSVFVSITGHDATIGHTVFSRHVYDKTCIFYS